MRIVVAEYSHYEGLHKLGGHHLTDYLVTNGHEILYVSAQVHPLQLYHFVKQSSSWPEISKGFSEWCTGGKQRRANLLTYTPLTLLPIWRFGPFATSFVAKNTLRLTVPSLRKYISSRGFGRPDVLMVAHPFLAGLLDSVEAAVKVYRINDDVTQFPTMPASVGEVEADAVRKVDAVVVTAIPLMEKVERLRSDGVHYLPNGVDYELYRSSDRAIPTEYSNLPRPIIVYMGAVSSWFDQKLLKYCANQMPNCTFVIIGAVHVDIAGLDQIPNIRFLGRKPYSQLPGYLHAADVGIIPFLITPLIHAVSPLKLFEYMACGLPVVATRWQELEHIGSPAYLVRDKEEFVARLKSALSEGRSKRHLYQDFAARNSWQSRGRKLEGLFTAMLEEQVSYAG